MAYRVSSINYVPDVEGFNFYVFLIGKSWEGGSISEVEKNFNLIGESLKNKGALIKGFDDETIIRELKNKCPSPDFGSKSFSRFVSAGHSDQAAFLLTSKHPNSFSAENDIAIYLPLRSIVEVYDSMEMFYEDLCNMVLENDESLIAKFERVSDGPGAVEKILSDVEIKPGFFGITVNVKRLYSKLKS
tara:strand:+ start:369 stop:932 length:564 start_codon:yes stop_codon:yes gene_type:complete